MSVGNTTLPFDFDIFLRSGSRIHPLIATSVHGIEPSSRYERVIVTKSHVRMMSCALGRRDVGYRRSWRSLSSGHPDVMIGVKADVAQVSKMSGSPTNPPGFPRC